MKAGLWDIPVALRDLAKMLIPNVILFKGGRRSVEELPTIGVWNLGLPLLGLQFSWVTPYTKTKRWNLGHTPRSHFPEGKIIQQQWEDKAKSNRIIFRQLPTKAGWWDSSFALQSSPEILPLCSRILFAIASD